MSTTIFLALNIMGLLFLLYVLANFWKEGNRTRTDFRPDEYDFLREERQSVLVVTHLITQDAPVGRNVIPLEGRVRGAATIQDRQDRTATVYEMQAKRFSGM